MLDVDTLTEIYNALHILDAQMQGQDEETRRAATVKEGYYRFLMDAVMGQILLLRRK